MWNSKLSFPIASSDGSSGLIIRNARDRKGRHLSHQRNRHKLARLTVDILRQRPRLWITIWRGKETIQAWQDLLPVARIQLCERNSGNKLARAALTLPDRSEWWWKNLLYEHTTKIFPCEFISVLFSSMLLTNHEERPYSRTLTWAAN